MPALVRPHSCVELVTSSLPKVACACSASLSLCWLKQPVGTNSVIVVGISFFFPVELVKVSDNWIGCEKVVFTLAMRSVNGS